MKYRSFMSLLQFRYTLKIKYRNLFLSFLAIENLQKDCIYQFLIFNFLFVTLTNLGIVMVTYTYMILPLSTQWQAPKLLGSYTPKVGV
jgi:hypothetical protein